MVFLLAIIVSLGLSILVSYIAMAIATMTKMPVPENSDLATELSKNMAFCIPYMLISEVVFLSVWCVYHKVCKISFSSTGFSVKKLNVWTFVLSALTGIVCVLGFVWLIEGCFGNLIEKFYNAIGHKSSFMSLPLDNVGWLFVNLLILGVVPAICEELLFRGIIFGGLKNSFGKWTAISLSSMLFALMHQNIEQLIYPFILGIILATLMEHTGNIVYPMILHMFNNFTTIVLNFIFNLNNIQNSSEVFNLSWWGVLCAILLAIVTCMIIYILYRFYLCKHEKLETKSQVLAEDQNNKTIMAGKLPFTMVCGIILTVMMLVINFLP